MKFVIPGGSGQAGTLLARAFRQEGHEVVILSRSPSDGKRWRETGWDACTLGPWTSELEGADVVINLAGRSVNCRYTPENRDLILRSRTESTRVLGEAISLARNPPKLWLQAGTATIYAHRYDAPNDDVTGIVGGNEPTAPDKWNFSITVATEWERALNEAKIPDATRRVILRSAMVMSPDRGGVFDTLLRLARFGLGGTSGNGRQFVSWVHERDFVSAIRWIIDHPPLSGAVNIAAPNPLPNAEFMRDLRNAWGMPIGLPAMKWMLEIGAIVLKTETELILKSRRVISSRLVESGFQFAFPSWPEAAADLCARWRAERSKATVKPAATS